MLHIDMQLLWERQVSITFIWGLVKKGWYYIEDKIC